jgi:hypothetical protein
MGWCEKKPWVSQRLRPSNVLALLRDYRRMMKCVSWTFAIGPSHGAFGMKKRKSLAAKSSKTKSKAAAKSRTKSKVSHPGMMGDGTEEQNLGERGNPAARIKKKEVVAAFGGTKRRKK